ncbi:hypothetical protein PL9631_520051 [Planktothrix paucivesiculata PCC 9631]|uniref:Uncharacterized protein n=1 Tax=Planktothrix paucivesiculata PCC 9631 TaxID=671071 RepID=A0A7Z9BTB4_9CYAN|nr:hypothetical protein PL9631_520051 [Planktothrix paucivesiculata PCC 9631]
MTDLPVLINLNWLTCQHQPNRLKTGGHQNVSLFYCNTEKNKSLNKIDLENTSLF